MASALSSQMSGQMDGLPGGDPGHVPEPAGGQLEEGGMLLAQAGGQVHQGGRGQVGNVGDHGHQGVVLVGGQGHHVGPEVGEHGAHLGVGAGIGGGRGGQHPGGPHEELARGPVHPHLLRAGHGVAADEAGVVDGRHQRALHAAHVGDDRFGVPLRGGQDAADDLGGGVDRGGHHHQVGPEVDALGGQGPELDGPGGHALAHVDTAHVPALLPKPGAHRSPDEPGAEDHGPLLPSWRPARPWSVPGAVDWVTSGSPTGEPVSRGGRHGVPGRLRGRRGGSRPGGVRW